MVLTKNKILILFAVFFILYFCTALFLYSTTDVLHNNDVYYGADTEHYYRQITMFGNYSNKSNERLLPWMIDAPDDFAWAVRHIIFPYVTGPAFAIMDFPKIFGKEIIVAFIISILGALNVVLASIIYNRLAKKGSLLFPISFGLFFANIFFFSIPESYVLNCSFILLYWYFYINCAKTMNTRNILFLGLISALAILENPELGMLGIATLYLFYNKFHDDPARGLRLLFIYSFIALALPFMVYLLMIGPKIFPEYGSLMANWGSLGNLISIKEIAITIISFFFYSVIAPVQHLGAAMTLQDFTGYTSFPRMFLFLAYCFIIFVAIKNALKKRSLMTNAMLLWLLAMTLFHVFFNPSQAFLYSSEVVFVLAYFIFINFAEIKRENKIAMAIFIICMLINNLYFMLA